MFEKLESLIERLITIQGREPLQVAKTIIQFLIFGYFIGKFTKSVVNNGIKYTLYSIIFFFYKQYLGEKGMQKQMNDIREKLIDGIIPKEIQMSKKNLSLPDESISEQSLKKTLKEWSEYEKTKWDGKKIIVSGSVYHGESKMQDLQNYAYSLFSLSNPLHPETFPYVRKMESEIIAMTVDYFGGNPKKQCGLVTSGGTESIILAIRAYKNWAKKEKGISNPELVIPNTAHAAFTKACEIMEIKCIQVQVNLKTHVIEPRKLESYITKNTIAIVGSAIQYPQGTQDPIPSLSKLALKYNIGLHIDCCLGSFLIETLHKLKLSKDILPFDFRVPGVTSISADTHKYGYSTKGTSVVMFRTPELRRHVYFTYQDWCGGMYSTPTMGGSRSGGVIAATWTGMMRLGKEGYSNSARNIWKSRNIIKNAIDNCSGIQVMGNPVSSVLGIETTDKNLNIFEISAAMAIRGWSLNNCQKPDCTHICITHNNYNKANKFAKDIVDSVNEVRNSPGKYKNASAAVYGTLVNIPDTDFKGEVLKVYMDVIYSL